jgi:site-specific DNA-methyltransferase (adenine-specific)
MQATHTVIEGDCLTYMPTMAAGSVAAVVTSPPYNLGKSYSSYNDSRPVEEYLADQGKAAELIAWLLKREGHLFLNVGWNSKYPMRSVQVMQEYARHLVLQQPILWTKSVALDGTTLPKHLREEMHGRQVGHFVSLNSDLFLNPTGEIIWHFSPTGRSPVDRLAIGVPYVWADQPARFGHNRELHCRGSTWHIPYKTTQSRADRDFHPSPFPVALAERCLKLAGLKPGELVLDPFAGTGATLVAAQQLGLSSVGIELDPGYCAAARRRLGQASETIADVAE